MTRMGVGYATKQYFLTTTLHGFKYLCTGFHTDRICWVSWCVASACCAGALCCVLWARFLQVPALLALRPTSEAPLSLPAVGVCLPPLSTAYLLVGQLFLQVPALLALRPTSEAPLSLPAVGVCLPPLSTAYLLVGHLSTEKEISRRLIFTFSRILEGKEAPKENLVLLEKVLLANKLVVPEALYEKMPPCQDFTKRCRWQNTIVSCQKLFHRELTQFGVCCVMQPHKLKSSMRMKPNSEGNNELSLLLECSKELVYQGCQFFTKYESQQAVEPVLLAPGAAYLAQLTYTAVQDGEGEKLIAGSCVSSEDYSREHCLNQCMEKLCKCSNPFRTIFEEESNVPPPCQVSQMNCLKDTDNSSCDCLPACGYLSTDMELETSNMKSNEYTIDPLYSEIDVNTSTVLDLRVMVRASRVFTRKPTETWFTLLSSLGGVFNMFLGVGLFSALELLFFLLVRLPSAIKHAPEMDMPVTHVRTHTDY